MNCLIVVDVQNDFSSTGSLPVKHGEEVVPIINRLMPWFDKVVLTQDWHPEGHISFEKWPRHCVQGSNGADFIRGLETKYADAIIRKGTNPRIDSYSGFFENDKTTPTGLQGWLSSQNINDVFICGLALDYCVAWTALDSVGIGRTTRVILDACKGISPESVKEMNLTMQKSGIKLMLSTDL